MDLKIKHTTIHNCEWNYVYGDSMTNHQKGLFCVTSHSVWKKLKLLFYFILG